MQESRGQVGEYHLLHKYLRERFADSVVLTFSEIEDLVGFPLPDAARLELEWWGSADGTAARSAQEKSWTLAGRNAVPNLSSQRVVFDRQATRDGA
jgi:hypothetical protein